jgi:hypothetical protein
MAVRRAVDLFGAWCFIREWGRIRQADQTRTVPVTPAWAGVDLFGSDLADVAHSHLAEAMPPL